MNNGRFKKGHVTWNKGMKGLRMSPDTEFKEGVGGKDHPGWRGGVQVVKADCTYLHSGINSRIRRPRAVYEEHIGKIPKGFIVIHRDGDRYNDSPENLTAISRSDNMRRNAQNHDL